MTEPISNEELAEVKAGLSVVTISDYQAVRRDIFAGLIARLELAETTASQYREALRRGGCCMTCLDVQPASYGCSDCLNTGWAGGDPYEQIKALEATIATLGAKKGEDEK